MNNIILSEYVVEFDNDELKYFKARDIENLCFEIANWYGFNNEVYRICMNGCKTCEEYILVTNEFVEHNYGYNSKITKIYLITTTLWEEK